MESAHVWAKLVTSVMGLENLKHAVQIAFLLRYLVASLRLGLEPVVVGTIKELVTTEAGFIAMAGYLSMPKHPLLEVEEASVQITYLEAAFIEVAELSVAE